MSDRTGSIYQVGDIVTVQVERVNSSSAIVRFENGAEGYIRPREMTLSANINPRDVLTVGQKVRAVVIEPELPGRRPELSLRRLEPDPWPAFAARHRLGDVIPVTVKHVYADQVLVEHAPGLDGQIPIDELLMGEWPSIPEEILKAGDRTEAAIIYLDKNRRRLILSVRRWAERLTTADRLIDRLAGDDDHIDTEPLAETMAQHLSTAPEGPVRLAEPILIVENEADVRRSLLARLQNDGYEVVAVASAEQAIEACAEQAFALALIDIDMPGMNGLELIDQLKERQSKVPVAVMSAPDLISQKRDRLRELGVALTFDKPLDIPGKFQESLRRLAQGEDPSTVEPKVDEQLPGEVRGFRTLAATLRGRGGANRPQLGLEQLCQSVQADIGVLFHLDLETKTTAIVVESGLPPLNPDDLYRLPESPVKDVILEEEVLWHRRVSLDRSGRFRNLMALFPFESCIGIPIEVGGEVEHALFLFARRPNVFNAEQLREAIAVATLFRSMLENRLLDERILAASQLLLAGQIASAITHEVSGKVMALDSQIVNMQTAMNRLLAGDMDGGLSEMSRWLGDLAETTGHLRQTMQTLVSLKKDGQERLVNVMQVLEQAGQQIALEAQRNHVRVRLSPAEETLPLAPVDASRLHHVFFNLLLNGVQWTRELPGRKGHIHVGASLAERDGEPWIRIRITDNGPGIHYNMWERIFSMGMTTRDGGSGLGLFIARSLVESMGGHLYVENSLMLLGTTFAVDLPVVEGS